MLVLSYVHIISIYITYKNKLLQLLGDHFAPNLLLHKSFFIDMFLTNHTRRFQYFLLIFMQSVAFASCSRN